MTAALGRNWQKPLQVSALHCSRCSCGRLAYVLLQQLETSDKLAATSVVQLAVWDRGLSFDASSTPGPPACPAGQEWGPCHPTAQAPLPLVKLTACTRPALQLIRNEPLQITYSYWDGTGHRKKIVVRKGDTVGEFLKAVKMQLAEEFRDIRWAAPATHSRGLPPGSLLRSDNKPLRQLAPAEAAALSCLQYCYGSHHETAHRCALVSVSQQCAIPDC